MSTSANLQPDIPSIPNLRDLGGHMTSDGRRVRSGLIYRSEQLSGVTAADMPAFEGLRLNKIYDLRTADERALQPDRVPVGADRAGPLRRDAAGRPGGLARALARSLRGARRHHRVRRPAAARPRRMPRSAGGTPP